ncbi:MAG: hypothetical protein JXX14_23010, partial [Deltaproteobacteria bacterium]|nr:hypothetical protein [Deltaproteobacteria bacterium]
RPHPEAIKRFLEDTARVGQNTLQHVLLLGTATVDSNDMMGIGDEDYVPTFYYRTNLNGYEAPSDATFVSGLPNVTLGRLAVRSPSEAGAVIEKLISWYAGEAPLIGVSAYVADRESAGERSFFADMQAQILASGEFASQAVPLRLDTVASPTQTLEARLDMGVDFLNYHGHAYVSGWSSPEVANLAFAGRLSNEHLFFVMSFACFDGMFSGPWDESLAWEYVANPAGGAFGALAGSSLAAPEYVELFAAMVTDALASGSETVGEAVAVARRQLSMNLSKGAEDTLFTYNLLSDPAAPNPWR